MIPAPTDSQRMGSVPGLRPARVYAPQNYHVPSEDILHLVDLDRSWQPLMSGEVTRIIKVQQNITSSMSSMSDEFTIVSVSGTKPVRSVRVIIRGHCLKFSRCVLVSDRHFFVHFAGKPNTTVGRRYALNSRRKRGSSHKGCGKRKKR